MDKTTWVYVGSRRVLLTVCKECEETEVAAKRKAIDGWRAAGTKTTVELQTKKLSSAVVLFTSGAV